MHTPSPSRYGGSCNRISITSISKFGLNALWYTTASGISAPSSPAPSNRAKLTSYSISGSRGMNARNSPSGASAGSMSTSVVVLEPVPMTMLRSSKLRPTPSQNRSSCSRNTSTSADTGVPTLCRRTAQGRQASSSTV